MKTFYCVSYKGKYGPAMYPTHTHFYCVDRAEQQRVAECYRYFFPDFPPILSAITTDTPREQVPFFHADPFDASRDQFFGVAGWLRVGGVTVPSLREFTDEQWSENLAEVAGVTAPRVVVEEEEEAFA